MMQNADAGQMKSMFFPEMFKENLYDARGELHNRVVFTILFLASKLVDPKPIYHYFKFVHGICTY